MIRRCGQCGAEYERGPQSIYCSRTCAVKAGNQRRLRKVRVDARCDFCDTPFQSENYQTLYCSKPCKSRAADLRRRLKIYDISKVEYTALLEKQKHRCGVCGCHLTFGKAFIDHDHQTNAVRGILCNSCNLGIGLLGDTFEAVRRATEYLRRSR